MKRRRQRSKRKNKRSWTKPATFGFGTLAVLLAIGYLMQINMVSDKSHRIRALENEVAELKEEREDLELRIAEERSMQVVEERVRELGMVPAHEVKYLTPTEPVVAKR